MGAEMETDELFMQRCLELAAIAKSNGKTAVGSLIVKAGETIAEGIESSAEYPQLIAHAEIVAILKANDILGTKDLSGCTLYTTVEPCFMCTFLIRETKINEVVFGVSAGQIGGSNPEFPLLTTQKIARWPVELKIKGGVMEQDCRAMLSRKP